MEFPIYTYHPGAGCKRKAPTLFVVLGESDVRGERCYVTMHLHRDPCGLRPAYFACQPVHEYEQKRVREPVLILSEFEIRTIMQQPPKDGTFNRRSRRVVTNHSEVFKRWLALLNC